MKLISRLVALLLVVPAIYILVFWLTWSLVLQGELRWIANAVALLCAVAAGWFVWVKLGSAHQGRISYILLGAVLFGAIGFTGGFFGPMIFVPGANQGPLLGIFITGPLGFVIGGIAGLYYWVYKGKRADAQ